MRKPLREAVRAQFAAGLAERLPQFEPVKIKLRYGWPGSRVFRYVADPSLHFFIELLFDVKGTDSFGVEVGWSRLARYPELAARPSFPDADPAKAEHWVRLPSLAANVGGMWSLEDPDGSLGAIGQGGGSARIAAGLPPLPLEEAMMRVGPRVDNAVEQLLNYALPYFEHVARSKPT